MSKWLVTLTYHLKTTSGGNGAQYIPAVTVYFQHSENRFVKFNGEYPTEVEINRLIEKNTNKKEVWGWQEYHIEKTAPTITFMQKLEEVEE